MPARSKRPNGCTVASNIWTAWICGKGSMTTTRSPSSAVHSRTGRSPNALCSSARCTIDRRVRRECERGLKYQVICTNRENSPEKIWHFSNQRCTVENRIDELKDGFVMDQQSQRFVQSVVNSPLLPAVQLGAKSKDESVCATINLCLE